MLDILLVDDEVAILEPIEEELRGRGHRVTVALDGAEAMHCIDSRLFDVVITDIRLPKVNGSTIFQRLRRERPSTDVILMTAFGTIPDAVAAIKQQARYYFPKPFNLDELVGAVGRIEQRRQCQSELDKARTDSAAKSGAHIVGRSPAIGLLTSRIEAIASDKGAVLITGETGTGKELVARRIHQLGPRARSAFVAINCAAFPETLLEAELFGHERGAFTGATQRRDGRFKAADGGTLLLDEISEMSLSAQAKLLRVLQEGAFEPVGSNRSVPCDVRILSATNRDLKRLIAEGRFREDLYYRIKVFQLDVPPLRGRRQDVPLLVAHFAQGADPVELSARAWAILMHYPFPGNVRELGHAIQHAVVLAQGGRIEPEHFPEELREVWSGPTDDGEPLPLSAAARQFEREYILQAMRRVEGSRTRAAQALGISRKALWAKLRLHGLSDVDPD